MAADRVLGKLRFGANPCDVAPVKNLRCAGGACTADRASCLPLQWDDAGKDAVGDAAEDSGADGLTDAEGA